MPPVDVKLLVEEAEQAKTTGEQTTGGENVLAIEFYYGKVMQDGRWIKTGKIYWIYTTYPNGKRKRVSPSKIYRREKGITSIEQCPYKGRVLEFASRSLSYTGGTSNSTGLQGIESTTTGELGGE